MEDAHATELLAAIETHRLVLVCGAGLSMAPPSNLPSARSLADKCESKYAPQELPMAIRGNLEAIADYFLASPPQWDQFRQSIVDWSLFEAEPNSGHKAIADFLSCQAIEATISANFDELIEDAAKSIGEADFQPALEALHAARHYKHNHLIKIHGCMTRNRDNVVWSHQQISTGPQQNAIIARITEEWQTWLAANLIGRDLVVTGFSSDWSYLNDVMARVMQGSDPRLFYFVDPATELELSAKAPGLWALAHRTEVRFRHVPQSGAEFLNELRRLYSKSFLMKALHDAIPTFVVLGGVAPAVIPQPQTNDTDDLYCLRRDMSGAPPNQPVRIAAPENHMHMCGAMHLLLQAKGARFEGSRYPDVNGQSIRIVNGAGEVMSRVRTIFGQGQPQATTQEIVITDATDDGGAAANILREGIRAGIVRSGSNAEWITFDEARRRHIL